MGKLTYRPEATQDSDRILVGNYIGGNGMAYAFFIYRKCKRARDGMFNFKQITYWVPCSIQVFGNIGTAVLYFFKTKFTYASNHSALRNAKWAVFQMPG